MSQVPDDASADEPMMRRHDNPPPHWSQDAQPPYPTQPQGDFGSAGTPADQYDQYGLAPSPIPGPRFGESPIGSAGPAFTARSSVDHPISAAPASGQPISGQPVSGTPDPAFGVRPSWEPRIVPSPPPPRGNLIVGLLVGLIAGLLVFGVTGYFVGRATAPEAQPTAPEAQAPTARITATAEPSLSAYQAAQVAANTAKFPTALQNLAQPWLPWMGSCLRDGQGTIKRQPGERARVRCQHGDVVLTFVEYTSIAERDKVRIANLGKNIDARQLTPGVAAQREGPTPSGRTTGDYIEYAYLLPAGKTKLPVAALWWDDASAPVGAYLIAFWKGALGESWEPVRDLWSQHA